MTDDDHTHLLAAEYVIGTLDASERAGVAARRVHDPELDEAIRYWEARLSPLLDDYESAEPPAHVKDLVLARIELQSNAEIGSMTQPENGVMDAGHWRKKLRVWQTAAAIGYAAAAGLAALVILREAPPQTPERFVAVFQSNDEQPAFVMSVDLVTREILVRPVRARPVEDKTYQLWIASDDLGGEPKSLGLLGDGGKPARKSLPYDAELLRRATFGISVEPAGGSPTGKPTGKALHGQLIPADL